MNDRSWDTGGSEHLGREHRRGCVVLVLARRYDFAEVVPGHPDILTLKRSQVAQEGRVLVSGSRRRPISTRST